MLAISVRSTGLGMALFAGEELIASRVSKTAANGSYQEMKTKVGDWLVKYSPNVVVFESLQSAKRKGDRQRHALRHLPSVARRFNCSVEIVDRVQIHANKFDEAVSLARRFKSLSDRVPPKPNIWEGEPHFVALFEAVALGVIAIDKRSDQSNAHAQA